MNAVTVSKKTLFVLATLISLTPWVSEASTSVGSMKDSIKLVPTLGYNYMTIEGASANVGGASLEYKAKGGSSAAILAQMPVGDGHFQFESGLEYMESVSKASVDFGFLSMEVAQFKMTHLAIPLRAKYLFNPANGNDSRFFMKAGVTPTYLMSFKSSDIGGASSADKSSFNDVGALAQVGIGGDWATSFYKGRITMDLAYNYGLTKVFKEGNGRTAGYQLQAGYIIDL